MADEDELDVELDDEAEPDEAAELDVEPEDEEPEVFESELEESEEAAAFDTVTTHLYFFPSTVAVMVAVPAFLAVILPLLLTVATFLLEDFHVTVSVVPLIFSFFVFPTVRETVFALIDGVTTVTLHLYFAPSTIAVIVAAPFFRAVTLPFAFTFAMDFLLLFQVTVLSVPLIVSFVVCPLISVTEVSLSFTEAADAACTFMLSDTPGRDTLHGVSARNKDSKIKPIHRFTAFAISFMSFYSSSLFSLFPSECC